MISISITDGDRNTIQSAYAKHMRTALKDAINDSFFLVSAERPDLYLRDCLGGLRAEVRWRDGVITAHVNGRSMALKEPQEGDTNDV